jgi:hypothetical protein
MAKRANEMNNQEYKKKMGTVQSEAAAPQTHAAPANRQKILEK